MSNLYPIYLDLTDRGVLVVGGGKVATRKVQGLAESGASVTVVAPEVCSELEEVASASSVNILRREYRAGDLQDKWLVVAATDDAALNRAVAEDAARARVLCNVVDEPALCSVQVPSVLRRGLLQIAVSTGGASPALARKIRLGLEQVFGEAYEQLLDALLLLRKHYQQKYPDDGPRRRLLLQSFVNSPAPDLLLNDGDTEAFICELERWKSR